VAVPGSGRGDPRRESQKSGKIRGKKKGMLFLVSLGEGMSGSREKLTTLLSTSFTRIKGAPANVGVRNEHLVRLRPTAGGEKKNRQVGSQKGRLLRQKNARTSRGATEHSFVKTSWFLRRSCVFWRPKEKKDA